MVPVVRIHSVYSRIISSVSNALILGAVPVVTGPDKIFVLNQQASLIRDGPAMIRYRTDAEPKLFQCISCGISTSSLRTHASSHGNVRIEDLQKNLWSVMFELA